MSACFPDVVLASPAELERLEALVRERVSRRVRNLRLACSDGGLVLRGQAPSFYVKQMAQQAVMEATDMPILANKIEVMPGEPNPAGSCVAFHLQWVSVDVYGDVAVKPIENK